MTTAEIIAIGTELLLGETPDTNTRHIAQTLRTLGINLYRTQTIGDNVDRIADVITEALKRADIIITTGGLGPTIDDPTREAAARAAGVTLEYHEELWKQIDERLSKHGRSTSDNQKRQAYIPQSGIPITNPVGTAPAFIVEIGNKSIICLPGVPREMETLLKISIIPYLKDHFSLIGVLGIRTLHVSGVGEGILDDQIDDLETLNNPTVGLAAHSGIVSIRIGGRATTPNDSDQLIARTESELRKRLGDNIFGADDETLEEVSLQAVAKNGWTLASIEYQTGTALQSRLARAKHLAFLGGITLPALDGTNAYLLSKIRDQFNASAGIGAFCIPDGLQTTVVLCLACPKGQEERHLVYGGHPENITRWTVNMALDWLRRTATRMANNG